MKYRDSGVNIDKADRIKKDIAQKISSTWSEGVLSEVGNFGGLYELGEVSDPVLVSSMDGVGTKLIVAGKAGDYSTVGRDLVNHCVNDILVQGAEPLFFLDYIAAGSLDPVRVSSLVAGLAEACKLNGCSLVAGETAEMPGVYTAGEIDLAGCIVGVVKKKNIINGSRIEPGDSIIALPSSGLHTNGYSLARKIFFDILGLSIQDKVDELGCSVGAELLKVHVSYLCRVTSLRTKIDIKGMAHITGGGIPGNLKRILPGGCSAVIKKDSWSIPAVFRFMESRGDIEESDMFRTFNMGVGMIIVCSAADAAKMPEDCFQVGRITEGNGEVIIT